MLESGSFFTFSKAWSEERPEFHIFTPRFLIGCLNFMKCFSELRLPTPLLKALEQMRFETPTPIQSKAIPVALSGQDLIASARTGSGKTAAFCVPLLTRLIESPNQTALILAPTRELVLQIEDLWKKLTPFTKGAHCAALIGGASMQPQIRSLSSRPRLIIATPGRLLDHLARRTVSLAQTAVLVLDEADRMLDMGFAPQLNQILKALPQKRQTLLFSATWSAEMDRLSARYLKSPARVEADTASRAAPSIEQSVLSTTAPRKNEALLDEINQTEGSVLVFARTQHRTDRVARYLSSYGLNVHRIHGGRSQGQRNTALRAFKTGESRILIATDIAARGIDVAHIAHVINYDLPQSPEDYVHRIGRTGRAGATGKAVSFVTPEDRDNWKQILKLLQKSGSKLPSPRENASVALS